MEASFACYPQLGAKAKPAPCPYYSVAVDKSTNSLTAAKSIG